MHVLCSTYHKLPGEVNQEKYEDILALLTCLEVQQKVEEARHKGRRGDRGR
jgi:hypothetical protein